MAEYEWTPFTIYDTATISPSSTSTTFDFGSTPGSEPTERLYDLGESRLIRCALEQRLPIASVLHKLGIRFPACWLALEVPTRLLVREWQHDKPGDIDIVAGNIDGNCPLFDHVVAMQVKVRKVAAPEDLRSFPSGRGTTQAHYTALMGFDQTLLLHFLVREPQPVRDGQAPNWNPFANASFYEAKRRCFDAVRYRLERDLYGYGWLGWGQAYGKEWNVCGGFSDEIIVPPPFRPNRDDLDVRRARQALHDGISRMIGRCSVLPRTLPIIWDAREAAS